MSRLFPVCIVLVAAVLAVAGMAAADTIYLKNGLVIRTDSARVEEGRVVFEQYGAKIAIPLEVVERVEEDDFKGPAPTAPAMIPAAEQRPTEPTKEQTPASAATETSGRAAHQTAESDAVPPEQTREYWQELVSAIEAEHEALEDELVFLRRAERAFLFSHRSTAEVKERIRAVNERLAELDEAPALLRREARHRGIPPGWLRIR
ncbi:MAG: hypothetical protein ACE5HV_03170 [Acidobacteriota bacterium]